MADRTDDPRPARRVRIPGLRFLAGWLLLVVAGRADAATPLFNAPFVAYETEEVPVAVEGADLNGDGWMDLVSANVRRSSLSVFLGHGDGTFGARHGHTTSFGPRALAIGDIDGDGFQDVAAACYVRSVVTILHGAGDGGFDDHTDVDMGFEPKGIGLDDLNGDHVADLMTLNSAYNNPPGSFTLRLGNGDGTFGALSEFGTGGVAACYRVADMDADGHADLVVANATPNEVTILFGNGDGSFERTEHAELTGTPAGMCVGDWNGDARPDVAVYHDRQELGTWIRRIALFVGAPGGSLTPAGDLFALTFIVDLDSGDVDGDGDLDLIAQGLQAAVYPGHGDAHFDLPHPYEVGALPADLFVGDLDADHKPDLVVAAMDSQTLSVLLGHGDGTFGISPIATGHAPQSVLLDDLDGDGDLDLAAACQTNGIVTVHTGNGDGTFGLRRDLQVSTKLASVAAGDLNGDGRQDLAAVSFDERTGGILSVMLANPVGGWFPHVDRNLAGPATCVVLGDWNQDGKLDAAASEWTAPHPNACHVEVLFGAGDGSFASDTLQAVGPLPMGLTAGDADGDGDLDLVTSYRRSMVAFDGGISVLLGDGHGNFAPHSDFDTGNEPRGVVIGDLDGDTVPDLVVANSAYTARGETGTLTILRGLGGGNFISHGEYPTGYETFGVTLADWDADGHVDVAAANAASSTVTVYRNRGDGTFADRLDLGTGVRPTIIAHGDVDGDGKPDLVAANTYATTVTLLMNRTVTTPIWVEELAAAVAADGVHLEWRLAPNAVVQLDGVHVERAAAAGGPYTTLTRTALEPARDMRWLDASPEPGSRAWYRLALVDRSGATRFIGPVGASPLPGTATLALEAPRRAGDGALEIRYQLGSPASDLRLVVIDVAGRRIRTLTSGAVGAGAHQYRWDRSDAAGRRLSRGVYWIQLSASGRDVTRKIVLSRP